MSSLNWGWLFGNSFLSDVTVELSSKRAWGSPTGETDCVQIPAHAVLLAHSSALLRSLLEACLCDDAASQEQSGRAGRIVRLPVEPGQEHAGLVVLRGMYDPHWLSCRSLETQPELLVAALRLADQWQTDLVVMAAARALSASSASWPWSTTAALLDLPHALLASPQVRPLQRRAMEEVMRDLGNLEAAWGKPELRGKFLALPIDVVEHLLASQDLQVANENTVLTALTDYVELGRGAQATPQQLAGLLQSCRLHHCSPSFFLNVFLARPWVAKAAAVMASASDPDSDSGCESYSTSASGGTSTAHSSDSEVGGVARLQLPLPGIKPQHSAGPVCSTSGSGGSSSAGLRVGEQGSRATTSDPGLGAVADLRSTTLSSSSLSCLPCMRASEGGQAGCGPSLPASSLASLSACLTRSATAMSAHPSRGLPSRTVPSGSSSRGARQVNMLVQGASKGLLQLVSQFALAKGGCLDAARATGVLGSVHGVPDVLTEPARPDGDGATAGVLTLEVPLHRLRAEMEALMQLRTRTSSPPALVNTSSSRHSGPPGASTASRSSGNPSMGSNTAAASGGSPRSAHTRRNSAPLAGPHDARDASATAAGSTGSGASAGASGSISSPNLVTSPTVVWAGWVWALDIFVARDPDEPVLGVSVHVLYPALGLPATSPSSPPPLPDIHAMLGAMMTQSSPGSDRASSPDSPQARVLQAELFTPRGSLNTSAAGLPRVRTGRHLPAPPHLGFGHSSLRGANSASGVAPPGHHSLPPLGVRSSPANSHTSSVLLAGGQASRAGHTRSPSSILASELFYPASPARNLLGTPFAPQAPVPAAGVAPAPGTGGSAFAVRAPPGAYSSSGGGSGSGLVAGKVQAAKPAPLTPPPPPTGARSWAVSADVRLCVYDHELEQWVHIYPQPLRTNTALELVAPAPASAPASRKMTSGSGAPPSSAQVESSRRKDRSRSASGHAASSGGSDASGAGSRNSSAGGAAPSDTVPFHADCYKVTYTDYYSVWAGPILAKVVHEPLSWQRRAYAPDGRLKVKVELLSSR
ncbi:hypothetical protein QJQ45_028814 [Haematococcus lacustris]|nr:hypothetical protein QJQ45_028814 [Haematococcus lacustris]